MKNKRSVSYEEGLRHRLKNKDYAGAYLNEILQDNDKRVFLLGLRHIVDAHGGVTKFSRLTGISREHLYRMLSEKGNPEFATLQKLLGAFNLQFSISPKSARKNAA
jgi:probable addiction module antidote protein